MAHKDWSLLNKLLECIDDKRNSIFLHIDKKSILDPSIIYNPKKSYIDFIERRKVAWGGYSQIEVEVNLLETAINYKKFDYYHLISGADLPIKSQDYIHTFF